MNLILCRNSLGKKYIMQDGNGTFRKNIRTNLTVKFSITKSIRCVAEVFPQLK